jgi:hypothetical protein
MRNALKRWRLALAVGLAALAGCAEEKGLPEKAVAAETPATPASIEAVKPEKEDPEARDIVTKAIAAHTNGKPERLDKVKAVHVKMDGTGWTNDARFPQSDGTRETWSVWPDRFAFRFVYKPDVDLSMETTGSSTPAVTAARNALGPVTVSPEQMKATQWDMFALEWTFTPKALTHPGAVFYQPSKGVVNGRPVNVVKAFIPGMTVWTLQFDAATNLLTQVDYTGFESRATPKRLVYSEHKDRDGLKVPGHAKIFSGTVPFWDLGRLDVYETFESADKIDAKKFETQ